MKNDLITLMILLTTWVILFSEEKDLNKNKVSGEKQPMVLDNFEKANPDWEFGYGTWKIRSDGTNSVMSHTSTETYGVALLKTNTYKDIDIKVKFRPISGNEDQSGGLIFRATDKDNYYLVRANALEDNFRFYKVVGGNRKELKSVTIQPPKKKEWHTLRVLMIGDHLQAFLNDKLLIDTKDTSFLNGRLGLWTKADSETDFDDFIINQ